MSDWLKTLFIKAVEEHFHMILIGLLILIASPIYNAFKRRAYRRTGYMVIKEGNLKFLGLNDEKWERINDPFMLAQIEEIGRLKLENQALKRDYRNLNATMALTVMGIVLIALYYHYRNKLISNEPAEPKADV